MKKNILSLAMAMAILCLTACQAQNKCTINGVVSGNKYESGYIYLCEIDQEGESHVVDSAKITNGAFRFTKATEEPTLCLLSTSKQEADSTAFGSFLLIEPQSQLKVTLDTVPSISGTPKMEELSNFIKKDRAFVDRFLELSTALHAQEDRNMRDPTLMQFSQLMSERQAVYYEFVRLNIDNELGKYLLAQSLDVFSREQLKELIDEADDEFKSRKNIVPIIQFFEASERIVAGKPFVDIVMQNIQGDSVQLSEFAGKGKYLLIDFWASWCAPCKKGIPDLVRLHEKYSDKNFEIVGISIDQDKEAWTNSVKELNAPWRQMLAADATTAYGFASIPHMILLDTEGKIMAVGLKKEEIEKKLEEVLKTINN